ncbi:MULTISPECIES: hypothetical protein [Marinobacter]|uniref:hypothetical protein n=1 Tax=Marinobacter TaxID=2742 RepID=UPI003B43265B|nr:hypothetical protein PBN92_15025 [Marinobacter alkaliphilus]
MPAARWGSHLSKAESSFLRKLQNDLEVPGSGYEYQGEIVYIGLHCECVDVEDADKQKFARLAIEDEIHRQFYLNHNAFGASKKLLSRATKRSARIKLSFDVESFAKYAISLLIEEYEKYLGRELV